MSKQINKKYFTAFISTLILFTTLPSSGQQPKQSSRQDQTQPQPQAESVEQELIKSNIVISGWLDTIAEFIDLSLTGKKISKMPNETRVRIENSLISNEAQGVAFNTALKVSLSLPNLEEYLQLKFTSYDDQEDRGVRKSSLRQARRRENYGASLGFFKKVGRLKTSFQPRVQLRDPLKITHLLRFETDIEMTNSSFNPRLEFFADPDKGTGIFSQLNLNIKLSEKYVFTLVNEGEYDDKLDTHFRATNGFAITDRINTRMHLFYALLFDSNNLHSYHLDNYDVAVGWNHQLYKRILDYQLIPHLNFPKSNQFKGQAGITLNTNLNF